MLHLRDQPRGPTQPVRDIRSSWRLETVNGSKPNTAARVGHTTSRRYSQCAVRWSFSPHPSPLPWGTGNELRPRCNASHDSLNRNPNRNLNLPRDFGSKSKSKITIKNFAKCVNSMAVLPWGEGEPFSPRSTIQTYRRSLRGARCSLSLRERARVRGNGVNYPLAYRTVPETIEPEETSGGPGGFPQRL